MKKPLRLIGHACLHTFLIATCFAVLLPVLYAFSVSLNAQNSILASDFAFIPATLTLDNYRAVLFDQPLLLLLKNTLILALTSVALAMSVSIPGAYSLSRLRYRGRRAIFKSLVLLYSFPAILSMFAIYRLLMPLGLINTKTGLVVVYVGTMAAFALLNLKGYFDSIPAEIEEAAKMDGAGKFQTVLLIFLPLARPAMIVTALMILIYVWNEYIYAITFMTGAANYTLAVGLYALQATEMSGSWPIFAAASITISLPILAIFFATQRHMISGLTAGGVKG